MLRFLIGEQLAQLNFQRLLCGRLSRPVQPILEVAEADAMRYLRALDDDCPPQKLPA